MAEDNPKTNLAEYMKRYLQKVSETEAYRWRMNADPQVVEQLLETYYRAECYKRGFAYIGDSYTKTHIQKAAQWLVGGRTFGLLMNGSTGNGKTTLLRSMNTLVRETTRLSKYIKVVNAVDIAKKATESVTEFESIKNAELLAIDDVGMEEAVVKSYGNVVTPMTDVLYHRYDSMRFTIITSNLTEDRLGERYGERIGDRMQEMFSVIAFTQGSYRGGRK